MRPASVSRSPSGSGGPALRGSEATSRGACQRPAATVPATPAIDSGLARISCWPIIAAARSTASSPGGTSAVAAPSGRSRRRPRPKSRAVRASASGGSRPARLTNAVLHDCAKSWLKGTAPAAPPSKLRKARPPTLIVGGQFDGLADVQPGAQQRRRGHDLEGRARRVEAFERAVKARVDRALGHRQHVPARALRAPRERPRRRDRRARSRPPPVRGC